MPLSQTYGDEVAKDETPAEGDANEQASNDGTPIPGEGAIEGHGGDEQTTYTDSERAAMAKGWRPEGVEGKPKLSADEFLRNEQFFDRIHKQNKTIKNLEKQLEEMAKQHQKIAEIERDKALDELKKAKAAALEKEDFNAVVDLDDKIAEVKSTEVESAPKSENEQPEIDPDFYTWQERNTWYDPEKNPALFNEATAIGEAYNRLTGIAGTELYEHVANQMRKLHPEQFGGTAATHQRASAVEGGARSPRPRGGKKNFGRADLNDVQKRVMDRYVKGGVMTEKEYIDELVRIGELS